MSDTDDKESLLERIWVALAKGLLDQLQTGTESKASLFAAAARFLDSNGYTAQSRPDLERKLKALAGINLPFTDHDPKRDQATH